MVPSRGKWGKEHTPEPNPSVILQGTGLMASCDPQRDSGTGHQPDTLAVNLQQALPAILNQGIWDLSWFSFSS